METVTKIAVTLDQVLAINEACLELSNEKMEEKQRYQIIRLIKLIEPIVDSYREVARKFFVENGAEKIPGTNDMSLEKLSNEVKAKWFSVDSELKENEEYLEMSPIPRSLLSGIKMSPKSELRLLPVLDIES